MHSYQRDFIQFAIQQKILQFGEFTLKSGRRSPYFFNTGQFNTGKALAKVGYFYAKAIQNSGIAFDLVFGPAYKGIPLVTATAIALASLEVGEIPYCFNRKEAKDHGEGGNLIGSPLNGRVLIIDDVITAGTAIRESIALIQSSPAQVVGTVIALDRQESGQSSLSAIEEIQQHYAIPIISIISLDNVLTYLADQPDKQTEWQAIVNYRQLAL